MTQTPPQDAPVNILVVDDQPGKLLTCRTILEDLGENLLTVQSAREALEILLDTDVAVILIDVVMPELDGFELAAMIREHPRFEKTAIMFVSGVALTDLDRLRGYSAGAVDYVPVPVVPDILRARVRVFVDLYRKTRQLERLNAELEDRVTRRTEDLAASTARWRESEERLRLALASARAGAWEWRSDTDEVKWSLELFTVLGLPGGAPVPGLERFVDELVHSEDRERAGAVLRSLDSRTGPFEIEFRVVRPADGAIVWLRTTGEVDRAAGVAVARGIHQDVTSRKLAELALQVEARRKDEFLATLAHELRNPLAPIATGARILSTPGLDAGTQQRTLNIVQRQVGQLVRLVDDLLDVSRISRGVITLRREPIDLAGLVRTALEARAALLDSNGHELMVELPEHGPYVIGDPVRLAQVVDNILDNAEKYTPGAGRIEVSLQRNAAGQAELRITDSGIGIPVTQLDEVFELFTQIDRSAGRRGLGIGLALVRRLVELHGGTVQARSEGPGTGTRIELRLPVTSASVAEPVSAPLGGVDATPRRILIVDDNVDAADSTAQLLELTGHVVRTAYDGFRALSLAAEFRPEYVLLDLGMPNIDGFETARRMRAEPWGQAAKLIAVSGWGQASDRQRTAETGFDAHLVKPVDLPKLLGLLV